VAVDRRNLRRAPGVAVHHGEVADPGGVRRGVAIQLPLGRRDLADEVDGPSTFGRAESDVEIELPSLGHLLAPAGSERATVDSANELTAQVAVEQRVLGVAGTRLPPGRFRREQRTGSVPVEENVGRRLVAKRHQAGLVAEQLTDGDAFLAGLCEFRPVLGDGVVEAE
jgi:hypothetical protein